MTARIYLSSGQVVKVEATGDITVVRTSTGHFSALKWEGKLKGEVPVIWPSASEVVMLTLD